MEGQKIRNKKEMGKKIIYLFFVPFLAVAIIYYFFFSYVTRKNQQRVLSLALSQAKLTSAFVSVASNHLLEQGEESLENFLSGLLHKSDVVYVAIRKGDKIVFWDSIYPGYLPIRKGESPRVVPSPVGSILEIRSQLNNGSQVYIGFDFSSLDVIKKRADMNFLIIFISLLFLSFLAFSYVLYVNRIIYEKEREVLLERQEKERFKEISALTASLSHELKNPINNLYLNLQVMLSFVKGEEEREYLQILLQQTRRLASIIETHLSLLKMSPSKQEVDIRELISSIIEDDEKIYIEGTLKLKTDPKLMGLALSNIFRNSWQAGAKQIWVKLIPSGIIEIEDDGGGVSQENLDKIFSPLYSSKKMGTGIGLTLVRTIVEVLGGRITAENSSRGLKIKMEFRK